MDVSVSKDVLMDTLLKNRSEHKRFYGEAVTNYLTELELALHRQLENVRAGKAHDLSDIVKLQEPQSYLQSYDDAIEMLTYDNRNVIVLTQSEFTQYVLDRWSWGRIFTAVSSSYTDAKTTTAMQRKYLGP